MGSGGWGVGGVIATPRVCWSATPVHRAPSSPNVGQPTPYTPYTSLAYLHLLQSFSTHVLHTRYVHETSTFPNVFQHLLIVGEADEEVVRALVSQPGIPPVRFPSGARKLTFPHPIPPVIGRYLTS